MDSVYLKVVPAASLLVLAFVVWRAATNLFLHPLASFPGPPAAALSIYWQAFVRLVFGRSFHLELRTLHQKHGDVVRVGPNELHFSSPEAYHDIYNNTNKWDKERSLYHSFGEDRSSFGYLDYKTAKERKDVLSRFFSFKATAESEELVQAKVKTLCDVFEACGDDWKPIDIQRAFRCCTIDVITELCFGISIDAMRAPNFAAPIIVAMDESIKIFPAFRYFPAFKHAIIDCPPTLSKKLSPLTAGLVDLQQITRAKVAEVVRAPSAESEHSTIFHTLMSAKEKQTGRVPSTGSMFEESQALMFGGGDTAGNTLHVVFFHLAREPAIMNTLKQELVEAWPKLSDPIPSVRVLEHLPYMNAVIREGLRLSCGVVSPLLRVVPPQGATIAGHTVPGGTNVACASPFVHYNERIFPDPYAFEPERWLKDPALASDWLVAFSRGPRACLGVNLAWLEMRLTTASVVRRFDISLDPASPDRIEFKDAFLPQWTNRPVLVRAKPVSA